MRCPPDRRHRSVCCGFECTYVSSSNAKSIVWVLTKYTRNPTSDRRSDARICCYRHTAVTVKQRPRDDNERHSTYTLNALKQKQCTCLLLYNSGRFPEKKELLLEGPQDSIVLLHTDEELSAEQTEWNRRVWTEWLENPSLCYAAHRENLIWIGGGMNPAFRVKVRRLATWAWLATWISWIHTFRISVPTSERALPVSIMNINQLMLISRPIWISYGTNIEKCREY